MLGYLRETQELANKAGIDKDTGLPRTGLEVYLQIIFPEVNDWVHDKQVPNLIWQGKIKKLRPDYRSESLKIIIEFDGLPHYQNPDIILSDQEKDKIYEANGYKIVRIPYFIQLTQEVVKKMFNVEVSQELFSYTNIANMSLGIHTRATPAYLCPLGIKRMAKDYVKYPECFKYDYEYLKHYDDNITGLSYLLKEYNKILNKEEA